MWPLFLPDQQLVTPFNVRATFVSSIIRWMDTRKWRHRVSHRLPGELDNGRNLDNFVSLNPSLVYELENRVVRYDTIETTRVYGTERAAYKLTIYYYFFFKVRLTTRDFKVDL